LEAERQTSSFERERERIGEAGMGGLATEGERGERSGRGRFRWREV
jgi:hypothetical protein